MTVIDAGEWKYDWNEDWARLPVTPSARENGRTHGVAVLGDGRVAVFRQAAPALVLLKPDGSPDSAWGDSFPGAHGLTVVVEDGKEYFWLTDHNTREVVKTTVEGEKLMNIPPPPEDEGRRGLPYAPTWVAVAEERCGGNGDIWVADGYGSNLVRRYDKKGSPLGRLSGREGKAGQFNCPHAVWLDKRGAEPEFLIADRGNRRVQVYDLEGRYKRSFGENFLSSPCTFDSWGEYLIVPELNARVSVLDGENRLVARLGENEAVCDLQGWPDQRAEMFGPGRFNSPHGLAVSPGGTIFVVEWITHGRVIRLERQ